MAQLLSALRQRTQLPLRECKEALLANNNDLELAATWLQERCLRTETNSSTTATVGGDTDSKLLAISISSNHKSASFIQANCKTSFAANSSHMKEFLATSVHESLSGNMDHSKIFQNMLSTLVSQLREPVNIARQYHWSATIPNEFLFGYCHPPISHTLSNVWMGRSCVLLHLLSTKSTKESSPIDPPTDIGYKIAQHCYAMLSPTSTLSTDQITTTLLSEPFLFQPSITLQDFLTNNHLALHKWIYTSVESDQIQCFKRE
jgi:translation elongation factor EF-Ts